MTIRLSAGFALGALLGTTAFLGSSVAQTPPAASAPPKNATAPAPAPSDGKAAADENGKADNKALVAYKAFFDAKLAGLRAGLQLTPEQAPLWPPVETAIRDLAKVHGANHRPGQDEGPAADPLHRMKRNSERLIQGGTAMKALGDTTEPLLAALDVDQKERLPQLLEGLRPTRILRHAFNLPDASAEGSDDGRRGYDRPRRHRDEAEGDGEREVQGRDRDHFGDRDRGGEGGYRESRRYHERSLDRDGDDEGRRDEGRRGDDGWHHGRDRESRRDWQDDERGPRRHGGGDKNDRHRDEDDASQGPDNHRGDERT